MGEVLYISLRGKGEQMIQQSAITLFQKAVYLMPELALKGQEKTAYELICAVDFPISCNCIAEELGVSNSHANQIIRRLIGKRLILRMKEEKGYHYIAITPEIAEKIKG